MSTLLGPSILVEYQDLMTTVNSAVVTTAYMNLGAAAQTGDGRIFRFSLAGAVNLAACKLMQGPVIVANHQAMTSPTATAVGDLVITATLGGTAATLNQYSAGILTIVGNTGSPQSLGVASNPAQTSTSGLVTINLSDPIQVATGATTTVSLIPNLYNGTLVAPTSATNAISGVTPLAVTAAYYFWQQTHGNVNCLNQGSTTMGLGLARSASVAGAVATIGATTSEVGTAAYTGVDGAYSVITLNLE